MTLDLFFIYLAAAMCGVLALLLASEFDLRDWGLIGINLLCFGIAMIGLRVWLMSHSWFDAWTIDLRWLWIICICIASVIIFIGLIARFKRSTRRWPPTPAVLGRVLLALFITFIALAIIHAIRRVAG